MLKDKKKNKACNNFYSIYQAKSTFLDNDLEFQRRLAYETKKFRERNYSPDEESDPSSSEERRKMANSTNLFSKERYNPFAKF